MEATRRLPRHTSYALQTNDLKWSIIPGTRSRTHQRTTGVGSGVNTEGQKMTKSTPVSGTLEGILRSA